MSINPNLVEQMLAADQNSADQLITLLSEEKKLLQARDHQPLALLIVEKDKYLESLSAHANERSAVLQSLGLSADNKGWNELLANSKELTPITPLWEKLQTSIQECKRLNEINGKLMGRSQQTLKHLLNLVRGQTGTTELYNAKGGASNSGFSNTVAKA